SGGHGTRHAAACLAATRPDVRGGDVVVLHRRPAPRGVRRRHRGVRSRRRGTGAYDARERRGGEPRRGARRLQRTRIGLPGAAMSPEGSGMKGETLIVNGDPWTIVDAAPAAPLAEMVAAILEDAGFVVMVRGQGVLDDAFSHLGSTSIMTTYVLVPEKDAEAA